VKEDFVKHLMAWVMGLALVAAGGAGCKKDVPEAPPPEGFVDVHDTISRVCADTSNTYECAKAIEEYRLAKGVPGVTRVGKRLSITTGNGATVDLTNTPDPGAEDYAGYTYTEHLKCFGYHLVHKQLSDGESYLLVHAETGVRLSIAAVPVLAPDCGRLAVASGGPSAGSLLQIWRATETGRAGLEWGYEPESPWTPGPVAWKTSTELNVPYTTEDDPLTRRTVKMRLYTDGWRVEQ
jgi:hypothetical protein